MEIDWPLVCRELGCMGRVGGRPGGNGGTFCWCVGEEI